jgi:hypothetical protein
VSVLLLCAHAVVVALTPEEEVWLATPSHCWRVGAHRVSSAFVAKHARVAVCFCLRVVGGCLCELVSE